MNSEKLNDQEKKKDISYLDWKEQFNKRKANLNFDKTEVDSFFEILPSWKIKENYALITIKPKTFKLYERGYENFKRFFREALELFQYVNPEKINDDLRKIIEEVNDNEEFFKKEMDTRLKRY